ncbi:hypothetical protein BKA93DRAFT_434937 [Sparassis latifolia]|uniref:Uncharacterized oxidoreductase n=1 Tax=Sparassis crispa TaxID=139825 RepID=A0A401GSA7_9APHY|nr:Uncharacterized oxidoreductase [Sparassis crispa]GBE85121.1 Uncharacterized oxidoreductase [Sparassis crispa]
MSPRVWFITGSSSGFGRTVTEYVLKSGDIAVATLRNPSALSSLSAVYPASKLLVVQLDVSNTPAIAVAFAKAIEAFGRVDVLFNNAGYGVLSEAEGAPEEVARALFDVNFWGAANVSREAVRIFREVNSPPGGRILQNGATSVFKGIPVLSYYVATKTAIDGFTKSLAAELDPEWNIKVTIIEPGAFNTDAAERSMVHLPAHPAYTKPGGVAALMRAHLMQPNLKLAGDATKAAGVIYRVAGIPEPPLQFPLGKDCIVMVRGFVNGLTETIDKYESWSEGLEAD